MIKGCLNPDPAQRYTATQLLSHPWFDGVEWDRLLARDAAAPKSAPPHIPVVTSKVDTSNFCKMDDEEEESEEESDDESDEDDDGSDEEWACPEDDPFYSF
eukprot:g5001.t1